MSEISIATRAAIVRLKPGLLAEVSAVAKSHGLPFNPPDLYRVVFPRKRAIRPGAIREWLIKAKEAADAAREAAACAAAFDDDNTPRLDLGPAVVYFVEAVDVERIKIGTTRDLTARLKSLSSGSPVALRLLHSIPGDQSVESTWHARFKGLRCHGEWFRAESVLLDAIAALLKEPT